MTPHLNVLCSCVSSLLAVAPTGSSVIAMGPRMHEKGGTIYWALVHYARTDAAVLSDHAAVVSGDSDVPRCGPRRQRGVPHGHVGFINNKMVDGHPGGT